MKDRDVKTKEENKDRPAYLWDKDTLELAKRVGDSIRRNEENAYRRLKLVEE